MPEIQYYEVEQTRTVKVTANSAAEAATIASEGFDKGFVDYKAGTESSDPEIWGRTIGEITVTNLNVRKEL